MGVDDSDTGLGQRCSAASHFWASAVLSERRTLERRYGRSSDLRWSFLAAGALLAGIGFTMSLFIVIMAYAPEVLGAAKVGILGAFVASAAGGLIALGGLIRRGKLGMRLPEPVDVSA